ncbi:MAG: hypothetical protein HFJ51_05280 [Clostridia bacterium]|nr:hypothetical protein [Clostridia bacterium]
MPRRRRGTDGKWLANIKQGYYYACKGLGLSVNFQCDVNITDAVIYAVHQSSKDIQELYKYLAGKNVCTKEAIEQEVIRQIKNACTEISQNFNKEEALQLIERYFGNQYEDITKPEVFIYGLAQYLRRSI